MKIGTRAKLAWTAGYLSGVVIAVCIGILVIDYLQARYQAPKDKSYVESMEEAVQMDPAVAVELTAERERQTDRSLKRDSRNLRVGYLLTAGVVLFLISMNWLKSLQEDPVISLERLTILQGIAPASFDEPALTELGSSLASPPEIDLSFVDRIVTKEGRSQDAAIPILRAIQTHYGYLPDDALRKVCELTEITPAQIAGSSTFYSQFRLSPAGKHTVKLCHGTACHVSGIAQITEELQRRLSIPPGADTDPARRFTLEKVACLGCCSLAPVMMIDEETVGRLTPASACTALHHRDSKEPA
jgi:NADH:ubiquinone oxidoreductase subunit E